MNAWDFCKMMGFNIYTNEEQTVAGIDHVNDYCATFYPLASDTQEEIESQAAKIILEKLGEILSKEFNNY